MENHHSYASLGRDGKIPGKREAGSAVNPHEDSWGIKIGNHLPVSRHIESEGSPRKIGRDHRGIKVAET